MEFITKQQFNINGLFALASAPKRLLLVVEEEELQAIYQRHLVNYGFDVNVASFKSSGVFFPIMSQFDLLILGIEGLEGRKKLAFLKTALQIIPALQIVTVGHGLKEDILQSLMSLGIAGHLDRQHSRAEDLAKLIKTVLFN